MQKFLPKINLYETGQNLRQIMRRRKITVRDVQEYLGLAASQSVYHWLDGRNLPSLDNLYALSELFDVPLDTMICGNRKKKFYLCGTPGYQRLFAYYETCLG